MIVLGIGGLVIALALTVGALAIAGSDVGDVVQPQVSTEDRSTDPPSPSGLDDASKLPSASTSSTSDVGGSEDGPDDDSSGPGSDDDSSGPGSDDDSSGPGSDDDSSGSGSDDDSSGSGSDGGHSDDDD